MIKPNIIGRNQVGYLSGASDLTTAQWNAIGTTNATDAVYPHAYSATVRDDYDQHRWTNMDDTTAFTTKQFYAFGVWLSAQNSYKTNFLFNCHGQFMGGGNTMTGSFIFGRRATSDTVVSSVASAQNQLTDFILLPTNSGQPSSANCILSCETSIVGLYDISSYVYFFGFVMNMKSAAPFPFISSIAMHKFNSAVDVFHPTR